jgi:hypothetical protein
MAKNERMAAAGMLLHNVKQRYVMLQNVTAHNVRVPKRKVFKA